MRFDAPPAPPPATTIPYRADIDGLRAIAVLSVVFFHAATSYANAGFAGVDMFFVISGYVITQTIDRDVRSPRTLLAFYERRARRIFPALFVLIAVTFAAAVALLSPADFIRFGKSLIAVSLFVSNTFFIGEAQCGVLSRSPLPLLHTWSLAVEEQFYLLFPLLLMFLSNKASAAERRGLLGLLAVASLILCVILAKELPIAALFLAQSRAWELLLGALLALGALPGLRVRALREALGAAGLLLIVAGAVLYTAKTPLPGLPELSVALGTAAVIACGSAEKTLVTRLLGSRIPVGIGLISYSLYLWHWPMLTMTALVAGHPLAGLQSAAVVAVSAAVAYLSWRYVERPFRRRGAEAIPGARIFQLSFSAVALACSVGVAIYVGDGWPGRPAAGVRHAHAGAAARSAFGPGPYVGLASLGRPDAAAQKSSRCAPM